MNKGKLRDLLFKHVRLQPPASQRTKDGEWIPVDWEWHVEHVSDEKVGLVGHGGWCADLGLDDIHSYQSGTLLLWGQLFVFRGGVGQEFKPFDVRKRAAVAKAYAVTVGGKRTR
jgi:hypothetical protein